MVFVTPNGFKATRSRILDTNHGTIVITSGNTTVWVAHGINVVPENIQLTPTGNVTNFWVGNITSTGFTIYIGSQELFDIPFYWWVT